MRDKPQFEWYVINENTNKRKIEQFNIFRNWPLNDAVYREVKKYLRAPAKYKYAQRKMNESYFDENGNFVCVPTEYEYIYGFDGLCAEIKSLIMWQEWSRCEYEILVGSLFARDLNDKTFKKIDCYWQCEKNIEAITREVIYQYKKWKKAN